MYRLRIIDYRTSYHEFLNMAEEKMNNKITMHLIITGRVQGVGYRSWAKHNAVKRELSGWVRNLKNGSVEMVISGAPANVNAMIEASWLGPLAARVKNVEVSFYKNEEMLPSFIILNTS